MKLAIDPERRSLVLQFSWPLRELSEEFFLFALEHFGEDIDRVRTELPEVAEPLSSNCPT